MIHTETILGPWYMFSNMHSKNAFYFFFFFYYLQFFFNCLHAILKTRFFFSKYNDNYPNTTLNLHNS